MAQGCLNFFHYENSKIMIKIFSLELADNETAFIIPVPVALAQRGSGETPGDFGVMDPISSSVRGGDGWLRFTHYIKTNKEVLLTPELLTLHQINVPVDTKQIEYRHVGQVHPDWTRYCLVWLFLSYALTHLPAEKHNGQLSIYSTLPAWHIHFCIIHSAFKSNQPNVYVNTEHSTNIRLSITSN